MIQRQTQLFKYVGVSGQKRLCCVNNISGILCCTIVATQMWQYAGNMSGNNAACCAALPAVRCGAVQQLLIATNTTTNMQPNQQPVYNTYQTSSQTAKQPTSQPANQPSTKSPTNKLKLPTQTNQPSKQTDTPPTPQTPDNNACWIVLSQPTLPASPATGGNCNAGPDLNSTTPQDE